MFARQRQRVRRHQNGNMVIESVSGADRQESRICVISGDRACCAAAVSMSRSAWSASSRVGCGGEVRVVGAGPSMSVWLQCQ